MPTHISPTRRKKMWQHTNELPQFLLLLPIFDRTNTTTNIRHGSCNTRCGFRQIVWFSLSVGFNRDNNHTFAYRQRWWWRWRTKVMEVNANLRGTNEMNGISSMTVSLNENEQTPYYQTLYYWRIVYFIANEAVPCVYIKNFWLSRVSLSTFSVGVVVVAAAASL